jgi:hypothetical protein
MICSAERTRSSLVRVSVASRLKSRRASSSIGCLQMAMAVLRTSACSSVSSLLASARS